MNEPCEKKKTELLRSIPKRRHTQGQINPRAPCCPSLLIQSDRAFLPSKPGMSVRGRGRGRACVFNSELHAVMPNCVLSRPRTKCFVFQLEPCSVLPDSCSGPALMTPSGLSVGIDTPVLSLRPNGACAIVSDVRTWSSSACIVAVTSHGDCTMGRGGHPPPRRGTTATAAAAADDVDQNGGGHCIVYALGRILCRNVL